MKNLLIILLFIPLISFGQQTTTINNNTDVRVGTSRQAVWANKKSEGEGTSYLGKRFYRIQQTASTDLGSYRKQVKKAIKKIKSFAAGQGFSYKIINEEKVKVPVGFGVSRCVMTFQLIDKNGNVAISEIDADKEKDDSRKKIIELKEYLDLGIITQDEFNENAASLKKILFGNTILKAKKIPEDLPLPEVTDSEELIEENYIITTLNGKVIKARMYRLTKAKGFIDIQTLDGKFIRLKVNTVTSVSKGGKEIFKK